MNVYIEDNALIIGNASVSLAHCPDWQRQSLLEAIWAESDAAERDLDTRIEAARVDIQNDARADLAYDLRQVLAQHQRKADLHDSDDVANAIEELINDLRELLP